MQSDVRACHGKRWASPLRPISLQRRRTTPMATSSRPSAQRQRRLIIGVASALALLTTIPVAAYGGDDGGDEHPQPIDFAHNARDTAAPVAGAVFGSGPTVKTGTAICTTPPQTGANANTDCDGPKPHNKKANAANPTNTNKKIGGGKRHQPGLKPR